MDFEMVYYASRCLIHHHDSYNEAEFLHSYRAETGEFQSGAALSENFLKGGTRCIYSPPALFLVIPIAILPWLPAHILWMVLTAGCLVVAAFLVLDIAGKFSNNLAVFLTCFLLANCEILVAGGNTAGLAVGLCVIAAWCFLQERLTIVGIVALAVSLSIKPHDSGFVWLYFLLAGGVYRRRAFQTFALVVFLGVFAMVWVSVLAPNWPIEIGRNLAAISAPGGINDPGPAATTGSGPHTIISLQSVISIFNDEPRVYSSATFAVCIPILLIWMFATFRSRFLPSQAYLGIAAIAAISMLPVYHRLYDAKILLLTIPACALLWAEGGLIGWLALLLTSVAIVSTGDIPAIILQIVTSDLHISTNTFSGQLTKIAVERPYPIVLLAVGGFYLWAYVRVTSSEENSIDLIGTKVIPSPLT